MLRFKALMVPIMAMVILAAAPAVTALGSGIGSGEACALVVPSQDDEEADSLLEACLDEVDNLFQECLDDTDWWELHKKVWCGIKAYVQMLACGLAFE